MTGSPLGLRPLLAAINALFGIFAAVKTMCSFLWLPAVQSVKREQDPACLTPKGCFVATETIEREVRQIGEMQVAARELCIRALRSNPVPLYCADPISCSHPCFTFVRVGSCADRMDNCRR